MADFPEQDKKLGLSQVQVGTPEKRRYVTAYDPAFGLRVCERVALGETLKKICAPDQVPLMPHQMTIYRWITMYPEFARAYAAARALSAHSMEEEAVEAARALKNDKTKTAVDVRAIEVLANQLRWSAAKRDPRTFSDRGAVQITVPIQINTSLDMGQKGDDVGSSGSYTIEATVNNYPEEGKETNYTDEMLRDTPPLIEPRHKGRKPGPDVPSKPHKPRKRGQYG